MIHVTCDCCKRPLHPDTDMRYVVKVEVYASLDPAENGIDPDQDHLQEIQDILQRLDDVEDDRIGADVFQQLRFDLCSECRRRFLENPLGSPTSKQFDFSKN